MAPSSSRFPERSPAPDPFLDVVYRVMFMLMALPIAPALILGMLLGRWLKGRDERVLALMILAAVVGDLVLFLLLHPLLAINALLDEIISQIHHTFVWMRLLQVLWPLWAMSLLLMPMIAVVWMVFLPKRAGDQAVEGLTQEEERRTRASQRAKRRLRAPLPPAVRGQGVLGVSAGGDLPWKRGHLFFLPAQELGQHGVVIGASGSGKTETLLRLAVMAASVLGWQVIFIDGKGDTQTARRFAAAMRSAGLERIRVFPDETYNGWIGDLDGLLNRLLAIEDFSESAYYRAVAENIVALGLEAGNELPRNSQELLRRLRLGSLLSYYKNVRGAIEQTAYLEATPKRDLAGVYNRYRATFGKLRGRLDGSWSYEDVDAAYLLLDGLALRELASGVGRYLIEDFAHYAGLRKPFERRVLFLFDELSAIDADVTNLFERVRSKNVSIFVSGQSYEGLGYRGMLSKAHRIVAAATTIIVHACSDPDELIRRGGKVRTSETGYYFEEEERSTGRGTVRVKEELRVSAEQVRQLEVGECYVIAHGRAERVRVSHVQEGPLEERKRMYPRGTLRLRALWKHVGSRVFMPVKQWMPLSRREEAEQDPHNAATQAFVLPAGEQAEVSKGVDEEDDPDSIE